MITQTMALAGLHNISALGPSFFVESHSPGSRLLNERLDRNSSQTSSLLQMCSELENDHVLSPRMQSQRESSVDVSEVADETENQGLTVGADISQEDDDSIVSEQSSDMGDRERRRVRQAFKERMNSGAETSSRDYFQASNNLGPQCVNDKVCDRARIIREWVQMNAQQGSNGEASRKEVAGAGSQVEQVRNRIINSHSELGGRKPVRRLCGRQTLLDLLVRAQSERNRELQGLAEQRPVSDFSHRNRIQALLRGRFLRNDISMPVTRQSSTAATELGLLGQRHTVSDLREGFLSKLHNSASTSMNSAEPSSSSDDENDGEAEVTYTVRVGTEIYPTSDLGSTADENTSQHEFASQVTQVEDSILHYDINVQEVPLNVESFRDMVEEPILVGETSGLEASANVEFIVDRHYSEPNNATLPNESSLEFLNVNSSVSPEVSREHYEPTSGAGHVHTLAEQATYLEVSTNEEFSIQDSSTLVEEVQQSEMGIEGNAWHHGTSVVPTDWTDASRENMARSWPETSDNQWLQEAFDDDGVGQVQESSGDWPNHDLQEAIDSWLDMPSGDTNLSVGGTDRFYFPDNDNNQSMELRELLSRRRVSGLLRSNFRESLDQVLQSHMERQGGRASGDWEVDAASSSTSIEPEPEQLGGVHTLAPSDGAEIDTAHPLSTHRSLPLPLWDEQLQRESWQRNSDLHFGTEWELINDLRVDMARLQLRMNNMQTMLEACMELQIELQRSVRQEVSAALNHSIPSRASSNALHGESQWDSVRKGICCLCCETNIDSLLYRCGHMCTCSKCAEVLVQGSGKCPMCQAPVVEVVRAYFIQ